MVLDVVRRMKSMHGCMHFISIILRQVDLVLVCLIQCPVAASLVFRIVNLQWLMLFRFLDSPFRLSIFPVRPWGNVVVVFLPLRNEFVAISVSYCATQNLSDH